ncbi:alpha/beta fold hydrolase [Rhodococcus ruber]|uniref:alpha/beta fold hydrolase n=1 Tax=Rhodococcus ruber TaxID=1830 RepID=UPI0009DB33D9|nr:alpha/beta hydrolase [Rhodococcus ruber]
MKSSVMPSTSQAVLVHGLGSTFETDWRRSGWTDVLGSVGYSSIEIDLPGHNGVDPRLDPATHLLDTISSSGGGYVDAIGYSAGAGVVVAAAARQPFLFRRIVLLAIGDSAFERREPGFSELADALECQTSDGDSVTMLIRLAARSAGNDIASVAEFVRCMPALPKIASLERVMIPTLILSGTCDFAGPATKLASALPQSRLVSLPRVDHARTLSDFTALHEAVQFLSEPQVRSQEPSTD